MTHFPRRFPPPPTAERPFTNPFEWGVVPETWKPILAELNSLLICSAGLCPSFCLPQSTAVALLKCSLKAHSPHIWKFHFCWGTSLFSEQNGWDLFWSSQMQIKRTGSTGTKSSLDSVPYVFGKMKVDTTVVTTWNRIQVNQPSQHNFCYFLTDGRKFRGHTLKVLFGWLWSCEVTTLPALSSFWETGGFQARPLTFVVCYFCLSLLCKPFLQEL